MLSSILRIPLAITSLQLPTPAPAINKRRSGSVRRTSRLRRTGKRVPPVRRICSSLTNLLPFALTFDNGDIAVDGQILEALRGTARLRPLDFQPIDLGLLSEPEDHPRIMIREVAATAHFELVTLKAPRAIANLGTNCIHIAFAADQMESQPVVAPPCVVP